MNVEIYNPDHLPEEFIRAEIAQAEKEQNRKARRAEFYRVDAVSYTHLDVYKRQVKSARLLRMRRRQRRAKGAVLRARRARQYSRVSHVHRSFSPV